MRKVLTLGCGWRVSVGPPPHAPKSSAAETSWLRSAGDHHWQLGSQAWAGIAAQRRAPHHGRATLGGPPRKFSRWQAGPEGDPGEQETNQELAIGQRGAE